MQTQETPKTDLLSVSDPALLKLILGRNSRRDAAWSVLIDRYTRIVSRAARRVLVGFGWSSRDAAVEEIVGSVWVRTVSGGERLLRTWNPSRASLGTYLTVVATREAQTWCRGVRRRKEVRLDEAILTRSTVWQKSPEAEARFREAQATVREWKERLTPLERKIVRLCSQARDQRTIARAMGIGQATVSAVLGRLRKQLERIIEGESPALTPASSAIFKREIPRR